MNRLEAFALEAIKILTREEEWDSETIEEIAEAAQVYGLVENDPLKQTEEFRKLLPKWEREA